MAGRAWRGKLLRAWGALLVVALALTVARPGAALAASSASPRADERPDSAKPETASGTAAKVSTRPQAAPPRAGTASAGNAIVPGNSPFAGFNVGNSREPINIKSDTLALDYRDKTVQFSGHVRAMQANGELTSNTLTLLYGNDFHDIKQMIADGNVRISQGTRWATGDHAVMNQAQHTVVLTGNPVVHDGSDQITGSRITVHLDTGKSVVEQARAVIFPRTQQTPDNGTGAENAQP
jgi:lipopolysaccharide export system protein LptA